MTQTLLNPYQRTSISVTLRALEVVLRTALSSLADQQQGILYQQKVTLSDQQRAELRSAAEQALADIALLAEKLQLPVEIRDSRSYLEGELTVAWSDLYDVQSGTLRRYGDVHPELPNVLDPPIAHLIDGVQQMLKIMEAH